jgi:hypothetical protein
MQGCTHLTHICVGSCYYLHWHRDPLHPSTQAALPCSIVPPCVHAVTPREHHSMAAGVRAPCTKCRTKPDEYMDTCHGCKHGSWTGQCQGGQDWQPQAYTQEHISIIKGFPCTKAHPHNNRDSH